MKSLKIIQTLSQIGKVLSKIAFIFSLIGFCGCIVGLISVSFGSGLFTKWGGVTIHGILGDSNGYNIKSITAALYGWMVVCAGEAVVAKFAEIYFGNEQKVGTPFTLAGAREMQRLGILTLVVPIGCAVAGSIVEAIAVGFMNVQEVMAMDGYFDGSGNIVIGILFIILSVFCRYGAELREESENERTSEKSSENTSDSSGF